jgi:hypothetical protein
MAFDCYGSTGVDCVVFIAGVYIIIEYFEWNVGVSDRVIVD